jgi:membrane associated rhomboid family serine protease
MLPVGDDNSSRRTFPVVTFGLSVIGFWFVLQRFNGVASIAATSDTGGVAYMAHIGGFVAGFILAFLVKGTTGCPISAIRLRQ